MTRRILLGVTADMSLTLLGTLPTYLAERGWDVHVVSSPGPRNTNLAAECGFTTHTLQMDREPSPRADTRALLEWVRLLRKVQPDVIAIGTPKAALLSMLAGAFTRVPRRIYTLRGLRYETTSGASKRLLRFLERLTAACAHHVVAVSHSLRDMVVNDRRVPARKIHVLGSGSSKGVELEKFANTPVDRAIAKRERWPDDPETPVVAFIGRLHSDKGVDLLLEASRILQRRGAAFRLMIIGDRESQVDYPKLFTEAGIATEFTGRVPDVAPLLRLIDILCLPTRREGFPNVVLEAAAACVPTVATKATGVVDAIIHDETGLICQSRDASELADALLRLVEDQPLRERLGLNARRRVEHEFSTEHVWKLTESFYSGGQ